MTCLHEYGCFFEKGGHSVVNAVSRRSPDEAVFDFESVEKGLCSLGAVLVGWILFANIEMRG